MQLQQFVTQVIEEMGGIVEPVEYALCNVLIPEKYLPYFQNQPEIMLAFDYEVAQENPEAEFVTFGSYILEQLLEIVQEQALSTLRFAEVERLEVGNPEKKLTEFLKNEAGKVHIQEDRLVLGVWAVFQYHITYLTDEKMELSDQVWINLITNEISPIMKKEQNRIVYRHQPIYSYPLPVELDLSQPLKIATNYVRQQVEEQYQLESHSIMKERDVTRISDYYTELLNENEKRLNRAGLSEEKKKEIAAKSITIELERDKQLQEIYNKYNGQTEVNLDHGILYFIPLQEFTVNIELRGNNKKKIIYYNPITKQFF